MFGRDTSIPESDLALKDEVQGLAERVAVVMMCGDPFSPETTLAYLMKNYACYHKTSCEFCITIEMMIDNEKQKMEVEVVSYHQAQMNCKIIHHAYILCYSPRRKASIEIMKTFISQTSGIPTLIVAVSDDGRPNSDLVKEGQDLADQSESMDFIQGRDNFMQNYVMMQKSQFLKEAFRKKKETENVHQDLFFTECMTPSSEKASTRKSELGQTPADSVKSPSKLPINDPQRKWWFKTRKPKGFLKGLTIEELPFRPYDEVPLFVEQCVAIIEEKNPNLDIPQVSMSVHSAASSFKQYFHVLSGPFVAYKIQTDLIKKFNDMQKEDFLIHLKSIVDNLSRRRYNLLKYVLLHLKRLIYHSDENKMNADVSICWWPCLLHPQSKSLKDLTNEAKLASIFTVLLENVDIVLELEVDTAEEAMAGEVNEEGREIVEEKQDEVSPNEA